MTHQFLVKVSATVLVASLTGCGHAAPGTALARAQALNAAQAAAHKHATGDTLDAAGGKAGFAKAVAAKGINLTDEQLDEIQAERNVKPSGQWAPRPAANLTAAQNLTVHFLKHGHEFRPAIPTEQAYLAQGNAAGSGERGTVRFFFDTTSFAKGYQTHVVRWVPTTHDFTAFRTDGAETTYYENDPQPSRFVEVPAW